MENIETILSSWAIPAPANIKQIYKSAWDIDDTYILKNSITADAADKSNSINRLLLSGGIKVAEYIHTSDKKPYVLHDDGCYCLMKKIKGTHIDPFNGDCRENGLLLGRVVAQLHSKLALIEPDSGVRDANFFDELNRWVLPQLSENSLAFDDGALEECNRLEYFNAALPRQIIHRDMHPGNLLFDNGEFAGYLDFDISQKNIRIFDICYLGCSLLVDNYKDEARLEKWRQMFFGILDGYEEILPLSGEEKNLLPTLFVFDEVLFAAFFAKQGQPEIAKSCVEMTNWIYKNISQILQR